MALLAGTHSRERARVRESAPVAPTALWSTSRPEEWGSAEGLQSNRWRAKGPRMPIMAWQQFEVNGPLELDLPITRRVP